MRSRTGFAIAIRHRDGTITLRQIPLAALSARKGPLGLPVVRGAAALGDMMLIGTQALRYSSNLLEDEEDRIRGKKTEDRPSNLPAIIAWSLGLMLLLLVLIPNLLSNVVGSWLGANHLFETDHPLLFNLLAGVMRLFVIVVYILAISLNHEVRRVFEYHGAEHKAVSNLGEGRDVTVGRARIHDTLHPRCGTTLLALVAIVSVFAFSITDYLIATRISGFPNWHFIIQKFVQIGGHLLILPIVLGLAFELVKYCARNLRSSFSRVVLAPGFFLQRLTTRQPDDLQLEVAISALFAALAISSRDREIKTWRIRGLEFDESAPGFVPQSPARPAPASTSPEESGMGSALDIGAEDSLRKGTANG